MNGVPLNKIVKEALKVLSPRAQDVVKERYGLSNGKVQTLESIGQRFHITRERVRQIENVALKKLATSQKVLFVPIFEWGAEYLKLIGGIQSEKIFFAEARKKFIRSSKEKFFDQNFSLVLDISDQFKTLPETLDNEKAWYLNKDDKEKALLFLDFLRKKIETGGRPVPRIEFDKLIKQISVSCGIGNEEALSYLALSKNFAFNLLGEFGLAHWLEIKPRGVKDKAYLVFRQTKSPLHFRELANLVNNISCWNRRVHYQTIHNELIRDGRFVLVGRGVYALAEWGYEPGTVKDVITNILHKSSSLRLDEIIKKVKKHRLVKENTILLNLQDRRYFQRMEDGKYKLKKK